MANQTRDAQGLAAAIYFSRDLALVKCSALGFSSRSADPAPATA
ncbi:MAG: hypothetical protein VW709_09720 [Rickettsiales bacterium]